jgi:methionyl-tRNA synthetase
MVGKVIPVIVNLKPAKIFGQMSYGMLLAAEIDDKCVLLTTDKPIPNGAIIT